MTTKTYPLEIKELCEFEGGHLGWWSKGHHDSIAFLYAVVEEMEDQRFGVTADQVRYEWWRCVPAGEGMGTLLCQAKAGARGAFPVTVVE